MMETSKGFQLPKEGPHIWYILRKGKGDKGWDRTSRQEPDHDDISHVESSGFYSN